MTNRNWGTWFPIFSTWTWSRHAKLRITPEPRFLSEIKDSRFIRCRLFQILNEFLSSRENFCQTGEADEHQTLSTQGQRLIRVPIEELQDKAWVIYFTRGSVFWRNPQLRYRDHVQVLKTPVPQLRLIHKGLEIDDSMGVLNVINVWTPA